MLRRGAAALIAGSCLAAVSAVGGGASATPDGSATITGEFVVYERLYSSSPDTNIGPFDHHQVFHPGGVGPAGQVCSPDRVNIVKNEITLTFDSSGGSVTGSGVLDMTCEYHPGCGWVGRTEQVGFVGRFDADQRLMTGEVNATTSGGETTGWGGEIGEFGCVESTWVQEPESFTTKWLFDLDTNMGYVTSHLCIDDPVKRIGWFTVTDGVGLVGPSVDRVASDDMATPRCVVAAVDQPAADDPTAADGNRIDDTAIASDDADREVSSGDASAEAEAADDGSGDEATVEGNTAGGDTAGDTPSRGRWSTTVWLILLLGVVCGAVGVWIAMKGALLPRGEINPLLTKPSALARAVEKEWQAGVTDPEPTLIEYEADRLEEERRRHESLVASPPAPSPAPAPAQPAASSAPSAPFTPSHEIVVEGEAEHGRAPGHHVDGTATTLLDPGSSVEVISDDGEEVIVRCSDGSPMRVDRRNVRALP